VDEVPDDRLATAVSSSSLLIRFSLAGRSLTMLWSLGDDEREGESIAMASLELLGPSDASDVFGERLSSNGKCFMSDDSDAGCLVLLVLCLLDTSEENLRTCLRKQPAITFSLPLTDLPAAAFGEVGLPLFEERRRFAEAGGAGELVEGTAFPARSRSSLMGAAS
jgi:hypothetical protein